MTAAAALMLMVVTAAETLTPTPPIALKELNKLKADVDSKAPWYDIADSLPQFATTPEGEARAQ